MSVCSSFYLIEPALHALGLDDLAGLQMYSADSLAGRYYPPLNPDVPVLLLPGQPWDAAALKRVLLNQYPDSHGIRLVRDSVVETLTVGELDRAAPAVIYVPPLPQASSFEQFQETIAHLRAPEGCPWDRKQTHASLRPYLLEETYEVLEALDEGNVEALREELGDLLLQIVLHGQVAADSGEFRMAEVIAAINTKIVRRHPHVWGEISVADAEGVKVNWDKLKQVEKNGERESRLDGVPRALPALSQAFSYQDRAARVHFDWETVEPVIAKLHEEINEVLTAPDEEACAGEIGDLLFAVVNLARWLHVEPESALRGANARFYRRFHYIEQQAAAQGRELDTLSLKEMDALWNEAKASGI